MYYAFAFLAFFCSNLFASLLNKFQFIQSTGTCIIYLICANFAHIRKSNAE